jgi:hypothetical protein
VLPRVLIALGILLVVDGLLLHFAPHVPMLGRLPGDLRIERGSFRLYIPITTCLLLSALLTGLIHLLTRWR